MTKLWRHKFFIKWSIASKVIEGHIWQLLCQNISNTYNTFVYGPIGDFVWMLISWRHNFFIKLNMTWNVTFILCRSFVIFFTLRLSELIATLSYVLIENFRPCLRFFLCYFIVIEGGRKMSDFLCKFSCSLIFYLIRRKWDRWIIWKIIYIFVT